MTLSVQPRLPFEYIPSAPVYPAINLRALIESPFEMAEGILWGGWLALSAYFVKGSAAKLFKVCTVEQTTHKKFEKIGLTIKTALVDLLYLGSSACYLVRWAESAKVIALVSFLPLVENLCYSTSLAGNSLEAAADIYHIWVEREAILRGQSPFEVERHKQRLCHRMIKLVADVCMVAWAALGLAALAGVAAAPALSMFFLTLGCLVGMAAIAYKMQIPKAPSSA